jgi:hypothetical protein
MPPAVILCWLIADRGLDLTGFLTLLVYPTNRAPAGAVADHPQYCAPGKKFTLGFTDVEEWCE